ncbi:MAG: hypothetical protein HY703_07675 [Gemmatimonadetes bacterium]|nr:hypothetical protein [Gemmatimonadota bacterium]
MKRQICQALGIPALLITPLVVGACGEEAGAMGPGGLDVQAGAVVFFNLTACPAGWSALDAARGRYLVGVPAGGTVGGTAGEALSNQESRSTGTHSHVVTDPGHNHAATTNWGWEKTTPSGTTRRALFDFKPADAIGKPDLAALASASTGITVASAGSVAGTNAPYLQLLACQKS